MPLIKAYTWLGKRPYLWSSKPKLPPIQSMSMLKVSQLRWSYVDQHSTRHERWFSLTPSPNTSRSNHLVRQAHETESALLLVERLEVFHLQASSMYLKIRWGMLVLLLSHTPSPLLLVNVFCVTFSILFSFSSGRLQAREKCLCLKSCDLDGGEAKQK